MPVRYRQMAKAVEVRRHQNEQRRLNEEYSRQCIEQYGIHPFQLAANHPLSIVQEEFRRMRGL